MSLSLPDENELKLKKSNRIKKLSPKTHKIHHESGRSTKSLWSKIVEKSQKSKK